ncbi:hypothetical protein AQUCO_00100115v1 [Aquilegia coerulea]|uniref:Saposin B-type domain-containing protein n=1 Tax=Aquilegia coerulea TaxID=218851 RepID=A0A2G5F8Y5_AQUCA|nr:hypothetical protein AQUCO_00100115v1 [Aquilegia coerulea]
MGKVDQRFVLIVSALLICSWIPICYSSKKHISIARKSDIPYIKCQVCEKLANELHHQVQKKQSQISPKKVSEFQIIEISENVCNLKKGEADWILRMDIVKTGNGLQLLDRETEGQCNTQCKTIERACQEVMGYSDTDVAEYMFKSKPQIETLVDYLCSDLTKACSVKPPPLPKNWSPAEPFVPKSDKEAEMEKLMRSMQGMPGAPGMKMYSKDDLLNNNFGEDDAEDDEDDEDDFPSKLGKVLKEKKTVKENWQRKIVKGIADTGATLKKHANKVSGKIRQWWKGMKTTSSKKPPKSNKADL